MTALKAHEVERYLRRPDPATPIHLVYGTDPGLVREVARRLLDAFLGPDPDPMSRVVIDAQDMPEGPGTMIAEARTPSLFGGQRAIRVRSASKSLVPTLEELLEGAPTDAPIVLEAGNLTKADPLRKLSEKHKNIKALPCFSDSEKAVEELIRSTLSGAHIQAEPDLVSALRELLGNDREITRRELEKLVLFAGEDKTLSLPDALALCGDNAALELNRIIDAVGTGHARQFDGYFQSALAGGIDVQRLLTMALYHFSNLRRMRQIVDRGTPARQVIEGARPRPHFSRVPQLEQQLRLWGDRQLREACERLSAAVLETRRQAILARTITERTLLALCVAAARR